MTNLPANLKSKAREIHREHKTIPLATILAILRDGAEIAVEQFTNEIKQIRKDNPK